MAGAIQGVMTPTIANSPVPFSYQGNGTSNFCLNLGFIPQGILAFNGTTSWAWVNGMAFGHVYAISSGSWGTADTGGVLDTVNGSGVATTNIATTTKAIGLVLGTSTAVQAGGTWFGLAFR